MGRRLTRKQIKQDEFITLVDRVVFWLSANWRQAALGLGGALVLGLLWWGVNFAVEARSGAATKALDEAMTVLQAPTGKDAPADAKVKFATNAERHEAAAKAIAKIRRYWFTPQARLAKVLQARLYLEKGDVAAAIKELVAVASRGKTDPVTRLATLDLLHLQLLKGDRQQVIAQLVAMTSGKDERLPPDQAMLELAKVYEQAGNVTEAQKVLRQLIEKFPDSPWYREAQQMLTAVS